MKTTVELPDGMAQQAKQVAHQHGTTLRNLIVEGLRTELNRLQKPQQPKAFQFRTTGGSGLQEGVQPQDLTTMAYE